MLHLFFFLAIYEPKVIVFSQRILPFSRNFMYSHVWNLHTRREELKTKFQLNIFRPCPIQRVGTYLGLQIPHNALLKWRELKQVVDNISYLELLQVTASNLFSTAECFLFATAILFIFSKLPLLNPRAQMPRISLTCAASGDENDTSSWHK